MTRAMVAPGERDPSEGKHEWIEARKALCIEKAPVPQTDTGSQEEYSEVIERTLVKELGKMTP